MNDKLDIIFGRRSIRAYAPGAVSQAQIQQLLEAAMAAPSALAKDPWRFIVINDPQIIGQLAGVLSNGEILLQAGTAIAVCGDLEAAHDRLLSYLLQDCAAATENLLLCAQALGLGACWLGVHPREQRMNSLREILSLPASVIPVACIALGHAAETKPARTRFNRQYVHFQKW